MSSGGQELKTRQELLEEYEKDYLTRLENQRDSKDSELVEQTKKEAEALEKKDYIGFCTFCKMGVARDEMAYKNNYLFHSNCFEQQGENFPAVSQELLTQNSNAKVQLALLKNLKVRTIGVSNPSSTKSRPKTKKKSKSKAKKRKPKRRTTKRRSKKRTKRRIKKRTKRRRTATKRRRPARRKSPKRKTRRRPARKTRRRPSRRKTRRRPARRSTRKKRARRRR